MCSHSFQLLNVYRVNGQSVPFFLFVFFFLTVIGLCYDEILQGFLVSEFCGARIMLSKKVLQFDQCTLPVNVAMTISKSLAEGNPN